MPRRILFTLFIVTSFVLLASCGSQHATATPNADMPNPASVYCEEHGGTVDLRQDASGGVAGICVFPDGSECDEWAYFRGECEPGNAPQNAGDYRTAVANPRARLHQPPRPPSHWRQSVVAYARE